MKKINSQQANKAKSQRDKQQLEELGKSFDFQAEKAKEEGKNQLESERTAWN